MDNQVNLDIQKTASVILDLAEHTELKFTKEIVNLLLKKVKLNDNRILTSSLAALPVSRFYSTHFVIKHLAKKFKNNLQIIELGAGFTPHLLNLNSKIVKYIEVDLEINSRLKLDIINELGLKTDNLSFISGDILEASTWRQITAEIDLNLPVIIFSEGVIAQYFDDNQKETLAKYVCKPLKTDGSCFIIDDTLRNHPELHNNKIISEGMNKIAVTSKNNIYNSKIQTFEQDSIKWKNYFSDYKSTYINYVLSKPDMDFVFNSFKLSVFINDKDSSLIAELDEISNLNKSKRIWL